MEILTFVKFTDVFFKWKTNGEKKLVITTVMLIVTVKLILKFVQHLGLVPILKKFLWKF